MRRNQGSYLGSPMDATFITTQIISNDLIATILSEIAIRL